jgi:hypothetical protein
VRAIENLSYIPGIDRPRVPLNMALVNEDGTLDAPARPGQEGST